MPAPLIKLLFVGKIFITLKQALIFSPSYQMAVDEIINQKEKALALCADDQEDLRGAIDAIDGYVFSKTMTNFKTFFKGLWHQKIKRSFMWALSVASIVIGLGWFIVYEVMHYSAAIIDLLIWSIPFLLIGAVVRFVPILYSKWRAIYRMLDVLSMRIQKWVQSVIEQQKKNDLK